jgi:predicted membrane protein
MTLLKFIFVVILIYYAFRILFKYVFPYILKHYIKKTQSKYFYQEEELKKVKKKKEGKVNIDYVPEKDKEKKDTDLGEYVDFEEIDK